LTEWHNYALLQLLFDLSSILKINTIVLLHGKYLTMEVFNTNWPLFPGEI